MKIRLQARNAKGQPLARVDVLFTPESRAVCTGIVLTISEPFSMRTDDEGKAEVELVPGRYWVSLFNSVGPQNPEQGVRIEIPADSERAEAELGEVLVR